MNGLPTHDETTGRPLLDKKQLEDGAYYVGRCRNASVARWNAKEDQFYHWREKFKRVFIETIKHPVDEERFDVFRPIRKLEANTYYIPFDKSAEFDSEKSLLYIHNEEVWCSCSFDNVCVVHRPPTHSSSEKGTVKSMSMSTHVFGIKPPDDRFKTMYEVWRVCLKAKVTPPKEVLDFFADEEPDEAGVRISLDYFVGTKAHPAVTEYSEEMGQGYEVDLRKLPADIKILRFVNSW